MNRSVLTAKINFYFAILLVTLTGSGAALLIIHVAYSNIFIASFGGSEAAYAPLQQSILNQNK